MTRLPFIAAVLLVALSTSCGDGEEKQVRTAFESFLTALDQADSAALWSLADDETRAWFDGLAKDVRETLAAIDRAYPEGQRAKARRAVGGDHAGPSSTGQSLFAGLLDPRKLAAPRDPDARKVDRIVLEGDDATVVLKSGDTLRFRRAADGTWRIGVFLEAVQALPAVVTLRENLVTAKNNCAVLAGSSGAGGAK